MPEISPNRTSRIDFSIFFYLRNVSSVRFQLCLSAFATLRTLSAINCQQAHRPRKRVDRRSPLPRSHSRSSAVLPSLTGDNDSLFPSLPAQRTFFLYTCILVLSFPDFERVAPHLNCNAIRGKHLKSSADQPSVVPSLTKDSRHLLAVYA